MHALDARVGGAYRISFNHLVSGNSHGFGGTYLELVPNQRIVHDDRFDDPGLPGTMVTTITLAAVNHGTDLRIVQTGIPDLIPVEQCYLGWQQSLELLGRLVEAPIPE